jgi:hypothetical protein
MSLTYKSYQTYQNYLISLNTENLDNSNEKGWNQYFDTEANMLTNSKNQQDIETYDNKRQTISITINQNKSYDINLYHIIITSIFIYLIWQA